MPTARMRDSSDAHYPYKMKMQDMTQRYYKSEIATETAVAADICSESSLHPMKSEIIATVAYGNGEKITRCWELVEMLGWPHIILDDPIIGKAAIPLEKQLINDIPVGFFGCHKIYQGTVRASEAIKFQAE